MLSSLFYLWVSSGPTVAQLSTESLISMGVAPLWPSDPNKIALREFDANLPTLTIDLTTIDTNLYSWKYDYVNSIPVSGHEGFGLMSGDINQNGKTEVYGYYIEQYQAQGSTRIYELSDSSTWQLQYVYPPRTGTIEDTTDVDLNGLNEVYSRYGDSISVFEQTVPTGYPVSMKLRYRIYDGNPVAIPNELYDIDGDGVKELLYRGSEPDSSVIGRLDKNYIARYDSQVQNFSVIWSKHLPPHDGRCTDFCTLNMALGDFDDDGLREFVTSAFAGNVYVVEHVAADRFSVTWSDSISAAGRVGAGDVDGNSLEEFFVGGTKPEQDGFYHMRILAYERRDDNVYEPYYQFNIFPVGYFSADLYQTADLDGDGQKELLISFKPGVVIIKGTAEHTYELFYYKYVTFADGLSAGDTDGDGIPELFVSRFFSGGQGVATETEVYKLDSSILSANLPPEMGPGEFRLFQNYPNPFNPSTVISFSLPHSGDVSLKIFNLLGEEVATLVSGQMNAGNHAVSWDATGQPSGVYFYRLSSGKFLETRKLVLLK